MPFKYQCDFFKFFEKFRYILYELTFPKFHKEDAASLTESQKTQ